MSRLSYVVGDATLPTGPGPHIIAHVVNNCGAWGAGFVMALSRRWPQPEARYRASGSSHVLGTVQLVEVQSLLWVANMCAQNGFPTRERRRALDYRALEQCLGRLAVESESRRASIHAPRFGAGIAGGDWTMIEQIIKRELVARGVDVTIYDLPEAR